MFPDLIEYLQQPVPQVVIWMTVLLMVSMVAFYVVQRFRDQSGEDHLTANELLTNFREMNLEGDIEDGEFRTIKTVLAPQLLDSDQEGSEAGPTPEAKRSTKAGKKKECGAEVSDSDAESPRGLPTEDSPTSDPTTADREIEDEIEDEGEDTAKNTGGNG